MRIACHWHVSHVPRLDLVRHAIVRTGVRVWAARGALGTVIVGAGSHWSNVLLRRTLPASIRRDAFVMPHTSAPNHYHQQICVAQ